MATRSATLGILMAVSALGCAGAPDGSAQTQAPSNVVASPAPEAPPEGGDVDKSARPHREVQQDAPLSADQRQAYRAALGEGRARHHEKDYDGAIAAFQRALEVFPDDARALSELGWAAFHARNFELAERSTRDAIQRSSDVNIKGASLYNLGRIQEAQGGAKDAVASYLQSLSVRPNETVLRRLSGLDEAAAAGFATFKPTPMAGPFTSLDALCADLVAKQEFLESPKCLTELGGLEEVAGSTALEPAAAPYLEGRLVLVGSFPWDDDYPMESEFALALRTSRGWYATGPIAYLYNPGAFGIFESLSVTRLGLDDVVPGEPSEVVLRYDHDRRDSDMGFNEIQEEHTEHLLVCGVGPSGGPSCVGPIVLASAAHRTILFEDDEPTDETIEHELFDEEWSAEASFSGDGELTVIKVKGEVAAGTLGAHALVFP